MARASSPVADSTGNLGTFGFVLRDGDRVCKLGTLRNTVERVGTSTPAALGSFFQFDAHRSTPVTGRRTPRAREAPYISEALRA